MSLEKPIEGVIRVIDIISPRTKFEELIFVGICIKSTRSQFGIQNWQEERENFESVKLNFKMFTINKTSWYNSGEVFVVPTKTFTKTKLEIHLKEHVLLGTGFEIEIYHRDSVKSVSFTNTDTISTSMGGTMTTVIDWQVIKSEEENSVTFKSNEDWTPQEESPQIKKVKNSQTSSVN